MRLMVTLRDNLTPNFHLLSLGFQECKNTLPTEKSGTFQSPILLLRLCPECSSLVFSLDLEKAFGGLSISLSKNARPFQFHLLKVLQLQSEPLAVKFQNLQAASYFF